MLIVFQLVMCSACARQENGSHNATSTVLDFEDLLRHTPWAAMYFRRIDIEDFRGGSKNVSNYCSRICSMGSPSKKRVSTFWWES